MNYLIHILFTICLYTILAQTLNLVVGYGGMLSLCHAVFYGIGAYVSTLLTIKFHVPFLGGLLAAMIFSAASAWLIALPSLRFKGDFFVLVTLGFQMIVFAIFYNWESVTRGPYGISGIPRPSLFGLQVSSPVGFLLLAAIIALIACGVLWRIKKSPFGRTLQAIRDDELAAASLGKNVVAYKRAAFVLGGAIAAVPGALFAGYTTYIDPTSFALEESIFILCILIIGGAGGLFGPIVGAVVLVSLPEMFRFLHMPDHAAANLRQVLYGLIIVLLMRFRPQGIFGKYSFD
jgi:branched-chain amino acid transport system permease protein